MRTAKGTDLPLIKLKGKDYLEVKYRLVWFREDHPTWGIETELVGSSEKHALFKATIRDETGRIIATAHKREDLVHFQDHNEKSETGAIGRALALCGYGTQFEPEIEEGDRIVDAPVLPRKPALQKEVTPSLRNSAIQIVKPATEMGKPLRNREDLNRELMILYKPFMKSRPETAFKDLLNERYGVPETRLMTVEQLEDLSLFVKKILENSSA